jgi:uracil-DNA glycosylase
MTEGFGYHESWNELFDDYNFNIDSFYSSKNTIYPKKEDIFKVFQMDVNDIRILLLGQDPYHGEGQAHGLSFSVPDGIPIPPSLLNIFKELKNEYPERNYEFKTGNLEKWFNREKIFLLNSSLSVIKGCAGSQMKLWEEFTDDVIKFISCKNKRCVFLLFGNFAKAKEVFIEDKNRIVKCVHPSPLAARNGFFNSNVFKKVESILKEEIDWSN